MAATRVRIASSGLDPGSIFTIPNKKPEQVDSGFRREDLTTRHPGLDPGSIFFAEKSKRAIGYRLSPV
jgi:hypothetical protein